MKRNIAILLLAALLLTGCAGKPQRASKAVEPTHTEGETTLPETESAEETETSEEQKPTEPAPTEPEETTPIEPEEETTPSKPEETEPTQPVQTAPQPVEPTQSTTQQTQKKPAGSSVSGRPTSSATCKDTGSKTIWNDPDQDAPTAWEVKADPQRTQYVNWLKEEGNPYFYYIDTDGFYAYTGRVYGVPLVTGYELFEATTWASSDPSVATVNHVGYVIPQSHGVAVITATYQDPETQEVTVRECEVTVKDYPRFTVAELEKRAHEEAKKIADYALNYEGATTDLERIAVAAALVHQYVKAGKGANTYEFQDGMPVAIPIEGYNRPFGTLVSFHSSCAGDTRALGLVLEYMGFEWFHTNADQWTHQWCVVYGVDGQTAFADASTYGIAGYGERKDDGSNWMQYRNGGLVSFR